VLSLNFELFKFELSATHYFLCWQAFLRQQSLLNLLIVVAIRLILMSLLVFVYLTFNFQDFTRTGLLILNSFTLLIGYFKIYHFKLRAFLEHLLVTVFPGPLKIPAQVVMIY